MKTWGDRWVFGEADAPLLFRHVCGATGNPVMTCSGCGEPVLPQDVVPIRGPGAVSGPGTSEIPAALARWQDASAA